MAGPCGSNDEGWRASLLYDCETREELEAQLVNDPFVKSGRLTHTILSWWDAVGTKLP